MRHEFNSFLDKICIIILTLDFIILGCWRHHHYHYHNYFDGKFESVKKWEWILSPQYKSCQKLRYPAAAAAEEGSSIQTMVIP